MPFFSHPNRTARGHPLPTSNTLTLTLILSFVLSLTAPCFGIPVVWTSGPSWMKITVTFETENPSSLKYVIGSNVKWLEGHDVSFHCDGNWFSNSVGTLKLSHSQNYKQNDKELGTMDVLEILWTSVGTPMKFFSTKFLFYEEHDTFGFQQIFHDKCQNSSVTQPAQAAERELNSTSVPLTEFPSFILSGNSTLDSLGYITWLGRFAADRSSHSFGLRKYQGGVEGGPIVLFDYGIPGYSGDVLVLSPMDNFLSSIMALRGTRASDSAPSQKCDILQNVEFVGETLFNITNVFNYSKCCELCGAEPACGFFSHKNSTCVLKYGNSVKSESKGTVSGRVAVRSLVFGVQGRVDIVPAGHVATLMISAKKKSGINEAVHSWGKILRKKYNTQRISEDLISTTLGYWTDNGAYYNWYLPPTESVSKQLFDYLSENGIPIRYLQLDPFWFPYECVPEKSCACAGLVWNPQPQYYPHGLSYLQKEIGVPILLYVDMFCPDSVQYYPDTPFMNSRPFDAGNGWPNLSYIANPLPNVSGQFYENIMEKYVAEKVMHGIEIDFMDVMLLLFEEYARDIHAAEMWIKGFADAAYKYGMPAQFCMTLPAFVLSSVQFPAVTNARGTEDNFPTDETRWKLGYSSLLFAALDVKPFFDVIWTTPVQPGNSYNASRTNILLQAVISAMSAGPVGIGDGIGYTDVILARSFCREDGVLLSPSYSATPIDLMFGKPGISPDANAEIWQAHSNISGNLFIFILSVDVQNKFVIPLYELWPRLDQKLSYYFVGNLSDPNCANGTSANNCVKTVTTSIPIEILTGPPNGVEHSFKLQWVTPKFLNGWSLLGEKGPIISISPSRFSFVNQTRDSMTVGLIGKPFELVSVVFASPQNTIFVVNTNLDSNGKRNITP